MPPFNNTHDLVGDASPVEIAVRDGVRWTAVMTKPRCEKAFARYCKGFKVVSFLPLRRRVERYQRRTVTTWLPMFPGYLFVQYDPARPAEPVSSHKILHILDVDPTSEAVLVEELRGLQRMEQLARTEEIEVMPEIVPGEAVRITGGPMHGVTGIVQRRVGKIRVTVNVDILGQSVAVEMDLGELQTEKK
jgi:transcription antitermination factor NusG